METHSEKPWLVARPYGEPRRYKTRGEAIASIHHDLEGLATSWQRLCDKDALAAVERLKSQVDLLPLNGGKVEGVCDPFTGMKYRATVARDEQ